MSILKRLFRKREYIYALRYKSGKVGLSVYESVQEAKQDCLSSYEVTVVRMRAIKLDKVSKIVDILFGEREYYYILRYPRGTLCSFIFTLSEVNTRYLSEVNTMELVKLVCIEEIS